MHRLKGFSAMMVSLMMLSAVTATEEAPSPSLPWR